MIPVTQTKLHDPANGVRGNCLAAAIASVLEIPIDEVPAFEEHYDLPDDEWFDLLYDFLDGRQLEALYTDRPPKGYAIAHGVGSTGIRHSVVVLDGEFVHDPHPRGTFLKTVDYYWFFQEDNGR
jgi:hypothetical protein